MSLLLRDLRELDLGDEAAFGGKAAGLGRLLRAGARVPAGFAVEARGSGWTDAEGAAVLERARALLGSGPLAVRSSAVGEDSDSRSFAGLLESVLDVRSAEAAAEAAARCRASGGAERVRAYAGTAPAVGVVFQSFVEPRTAGVCFTQDPDGRDAAVRIEAVAGRGDALVGGRVQPESWRVYEGARGFEPRGPARVLSATAAAELARQARDIARAIGRPLDLEWAIDAEGRVWWLQARPITAARPLREWQVERFCDGVDDGPVTLWANWNLREVVREPFAPLPWGVWRETILPLAVMPLLGLDPTASLFRQMVPVDLVHGRLYWNMNALLAVPGLGALVPRLVGRLDARAGRAIARLRRSRVLTRRALGRGQLLLHARTVLAGLRKAATTLSGHSRPRHALRLLEECGQALRAGRPDVASLTEAELLEEMRLFARPETEPLRRGQQAMGAAVAVWVAAERAFRKHPEALRLLAAGTSANPTTQISCGISRLAERARGLGLDADALRGPYAALRERLAGRDEGRGFLADLDAFLDAFGHRCPNEFDLTVPRWREDPSMILDLVRAGLEAGGETVDARLARLAAERDRAIAGAVAASPAWRRPLMRFLGRQVVACTPIREAPKHHAMVAFQRIRSAALELGRRFARQGAIPDPADVMYLEWEEVRSLASGGPGPIGIRERLGERRAVHERRRAERPPDLLRSDGVPEDEQEGETSDAPGTLRGLGVCGGQATGPVRVLRTPDGGALREGDVLVVEFADPGWTPLFPRAAAVVMEVGGAMSHAAVVARELGIPAVFGAHRATEVLADGDPVEVDGDRGLVRTAGVRG